MRWFCCRSLLVGVLSLCVLACDSAQTASATQDGTSSAADADSPPATDTENTRQDDTTKPPIDWLEDLPDYVQPPFVPKDNPMVAARIELGRHLFYETRISLTGDMSCGTCHEQAHAFAVPEALHEGGEGDFTTRNSQPLGNVGYPTYLTWGNLTLQTLEQQALNPLFGDNPVELGVGFVKGSSNHYDPTRLLVLVEDELEYRDLFDAAFPELEAQERVTWDNVIAALSCFQRSLLSFNSAYDEFLKGQGNALTASQERGRALFFSDKTKCGECHSGPLLSLAFPTQGESPTQAHIFRNTGLYMVSDSTASYVDGSPSFYPEPNMGIGEFTQNPADDGKHRIPSLRNVELTAPYMHDGSIQSLEEVLAHYERGGRQILDGPLQGDGSQNPNKDPLIDGFELTTAERADLIAFLHSLTDEIFITSERFSNPHN